ncbi:MAG: hypothetical protein ACLQU1_29365 [Bryobacteraceae bacterium]
MRRKVFFILTAAAAVFTVRPAAAATFGSVVAIGGSSSDIALDSSRGLLYIADFTGNRIDVMNLKTLAIQTSINVAAQPGAISLSPDSQYLIVAQYGNTTVADPSANSITVLNLASNTRQTFTTGDAPLAVAFLADDTAMIVTTSGISIFNPASGALTSLVTFSSVGQTLPVITATFPAQVIQAVLSTSPDYKSVYGIVNDGSNQGFISYHLPLGQLYAIGVVASPKPLPRVSVSSDGTYAMVGQYKLDSVADDLAQFPNSITSTNIGGSVIDSATGLIYAQILTASPASSTSTTPSSPAAPVSSTTPPALTLMDADNLTVEDTLQLPENITGRMILDSAGANIYAVSDSGVMVLPIGQLKQFHRVYPSATDVVTHTNSCSRTAITQTITLSDPGGGKTDFVISGAPAGVTVTPSSGTTPAAVQITVDPTAFQNQNGTVTIPLTIASVLAVNVPPSIRLLVNNQNPDQRGSFVDIPGVLTDILADPGRSRFYVVQQDRNMVLVYDSTTYTQIAALRTSTTPTQMAITLDQNSLIVGHDNSQQAYVYDLNSLTEQPPIQFPPGHYPRSIAASGNAILGLARDVAGDAPGAVDQIDMLNYRATELPSLGIFKNSLNPGAVLAPASNGGSILLVSPDGNVMLYDANANTFTVSRQDVTSLAGPYGASSFGTYVAGGNLLNASLVPQASLDTTNGTPAGFVFVSQSGYQTSVSAANNPGVIEQVNPATSLSISPTRTVEAPLGGTLAQPLIRSLAAIYDGSALVSLSVSGITVIPSNYAAAVAIPQITSVVNAANGASGVAPGGLISVYGQQMSPENIATQQIPLPTALGESCLTVNGVPIPVLFVSASQINGQLPFDVDGNAVMILRTPGGVSDNFNLTILDNAPAIFQSGTAGPETGLATIVRSNDNQLVTPTNPIHPNDTIVIYATGLGVTAPPVAAGRAAPAGTLSSAIATPTVTLGGEAMSITYAGLVPGEVGVYQINAVAPPDAPQGLSIPLAITQGGSSTTVNVRVVN